MSGPVGFARMAGSSIATAAAAGWVTDFLNAAYYARRGAAVDDLRLAHGIVTTRWASLGGRRLGARDVLTFNRAYGSARLRAGGRLDRDALLEGAAALLGDWFPEGWERHRAYGIGFPDAATRDAFEPEARLAHARLGQLTPPRSPEPHWGTYEPVALPDPEAALALLHDPARWPDMGSAGGRFTALRAGGLLGQTFEIEVVAAPAARLPVFTRGYVTCTTVATDAGPVHEHLPDDAEVLALVVLTTHANHFLGPARSHLVVWRDAGGAWIRDVGAWDPLKPHLALAYKAAGRAAQHAFWGPSQPARSMLAQLAQVA